MKAGFMHKLLLIAFAASCIHLPVANAAPQVCTALEKAAPQDLVSFLSATVPDEKKSACVVFAITELGRQEYQAAVPVLVKFLDFQRPRPTGEVVMLHLPILSRRFPAIAALEMIGENAVTALLSTIEGEHTSDLVCYNAVATVMGIYRYTTPKGIARLKQEFDKTGDSASRERLQRAMTIAIDKWCSSYDRDSCVAASKASQP